MTKTYPLELTEHELFVLSEYIIAALNGDTYKTEWMMFGRYGRAMDRINNKITDIYLSDPAMLDRANNRIISPSLAVLIELRKRRETADVYRMLQVIMGNDDNGK